MFNARRKDFKAAEAVSRNGDLRTAGIDHCHQKNNFLDCTDTEISHEGSIALEGDVSIMCEEEELAVEGNVCHVAMGDITCVREFQVEYGGDTPARVNNSIYADSVKGNIC